MNTTYKLCLLLGWIAWTQAVGAQPAGVAPRSVSPYPPSYQVNVDARGQNIVGDAANEPSLCVDPTNPDRMAIGWRQFDTVTNDFRQAGWAYSSDGGLTWTFPGVLEANVFRSDPVLAADAQGRFYYLSLMITPVYHCDLWQSTDGGLSWQLLSQAYGGDKAWMTIDTTTGPGRGNLYAIWSPWYNFTNNEDQIFSRSTDAGQTWLNPMPVPYLPGLGTVDVGPGGEVYVAGWNGNFVFSRSTNAYDSAAAPVFDWWGFVNLGGDLAADVPGVNAIGLLGQVWIAADRSTGPTRGNIYMLATVRGTNDPADIMFVRSTDRGQTWSGPRRITDDSRPQSAWHWFGTLAVAPNGRVDACWYDTRHSTNHASSQLFYAFSSDGGLSWSPNLAISAPFDQTLGYPAQEKIGDYISMVSLDNAACIAYTATFNGEEDIYFVRVVPPLVATVLASSGTVTVVWNAVVGQTYAVQSKGGFNQPWSALPGADSLVATNRVMRVADPSVGGTRRFYRVTQLP
ncbi:MAG: glycoside hydrolase [Verrucomicrobia bacterium]|nr:glycoside hydrolase [Verrucomicrobiota bacterium]